MKMLFLTIALALLTCVSGCTTVGTVPPNSETDNSSQLRQIENSCAVATAAIEALDVANRAGKLSISQQRTVVSSMAVTHDICSDIPDTWTEAGKRAFMDAVSSLQLLHNLFK